MINNMVKVNRSLWFWLRVCSHINRSVMPGSHSPQMDPIMSPSPLQTHPGLSSLVPCSPWPARPAPCRPPPSDGTTTGHRWKSPVLTSLCKQSKATRSLRSQTSPARPKMTRPNAVSLQQRFPSASWVSGSPSCEVLQVWTLPVQSELSSLYTWGWKSHLFLTVLLSAEFYVSI